MQRALIYRRRGTLVAIDHPIADEPVRWEWHLHTHVPLQQISRNRFRLYDEQAEVGLCIDIIDTAEFDSFQSDHFTACPEPSPMRPHGVVAMKGAATSGRFAVSMRIDRASEGVKLQAPERNGDTVVQVGAHSFRMRADAGGVHEPP